MNSEGNRFCVQPKCWLQYFEINRYPSFPFCWQSG